MQGFDGFAESLKRVADIGYKYVQISGTRAFEPAWLKEQLEKNGLTCVLIHVPAARIAEDTDRVIADHDVFGCKHIGIGISPQFKLWGRICRRPLIWRRPLCMPKEKLRLS